MVYIRVVSFPFTVYVDYLLKELEEKGVGCFYFVWAVCYADDIALLSSSSSAIRQMLSTCSSYATSHSLLYNANKTHLTRFFRHSMAPSQFSFLTLWNLNSIGLGHILTHDLSDNEDNFLSEKSL